MDRWQALQTFWAGFGLTAYDENTVPSTATYPRLTYSAMTGGIGESVSLMASIWYRSTSWGDISRKADEISNAIGHGGVLVGFDGGALWITRGTPFAQRMGDPNDTMIRRIVIMAYGEYLTST